MQCIGVAGVDRNKSWKSPWTFRYTFNIGFSTGEVLIQVLLELCNRVLDRLRMPVELALISGLVIFREQADIMNCGCYLNVRFP